MTPTPETSEPPKIGTVAQFRRIRIPLDVTANRQEMLVALNWKRLVATLIQMTFTGGVVVRVVTLSMGQSQPLPEPTHFAIDIGADDQMPVVRQQAKRKQFQLHAVERCRDDPLERFVIRIFVKDRGAAVRPVEHVVDRAGFISPLGPAQRNSSPKEPPI